MHCGIWAFAYVPWGLRILCTAVYGHKLRALGVTAVYVHYMHSGEWAFCVRTVGPGYFVHGRIWAQTVGPGHFVYGSV